MLSLILLGGLPDADACSCATPLTERRVVSSDALPTDGAVSVFLYGPWPSIRRHQEAAAYRLQGPGGLVALEPRVEGRRIVLQPTAPLQPDTPYTLQRATFYSGERPLTDDQAVSLLAEEPLERRWDEAWPLHTAAQPLHREPVALTLSAAVFSERAGGGDCGPGESIRASLDVTGAPHETDVLSVEVEGQGTLWRRPSHWRQVRFSDMYCEPIKVHTDVTPPPRVRAHLHGAGGALLATSPWVTLSLAETHGGRPAPPGHHRRQRVAEERAVSRFMPLWEVPTTDGPAHQGPESCPRGLSAGAAEPLGWQWPQLVPGLVEPVPGEIVFRAEAPERKAVLRGADGAPLGGPPLERARVLAGEGALLVMEGMQATALEPDGAPRWSRALDTLGEESSVMFTAVGGGRALVGWKWWGMASSREERWTLLDLSTGETVAEGSLRALSPEGRTVRDVAWDGEQFVFSWGWGAPSIPRELGPQPASPVAPGTYLSTLWPDGMWGTTVPTPPSLGRVERLLPGPDGVWAVGVDGIDLVLGRLDRAGGLVGVPVLLNPGVPVGGSLTLAQWGERVAVAWRSAGVWVTVVEDGRAAPPLWVDGLSPSLVATGEGLRLFYGAYRDDAWRATETALSCTGL